MFWLEWTIASNINNNEFGFVTTTALQSKHALRGLMDSGMFIFMFSKEIGVQTVCSRRES